MRKKLFFGMIMLVTALGIVACQKKESDSVQEVTEKSAPEDILKAANKKYAEYDMKGSECTYTYLFADKTSTVETGKSIIDVNKGICHQKDEQDGKVTGETFNVKEGNSYYSYAFDPEKDLWVRYEQVPDINGKTTYQHQLDGELFLYGEEYGYRNIEYSNEGKETVEGRDTIKIKVTMEDLPTSEDSEQSSVTKEDILSDYGVTEEYVKKIDGLWEALEDYVEAMNDSMYGTTTRFENYIWVDANDFTPVKYEGNTSFDDMEEKGEKNQQKMSDFEENCWKAVMLQSDMESGMSFEEAMKNIESSEELMNAEIDGEEDEYIEEDSVEEDTEPEQIGFQTVEIYRYGKECGSLDPLPSNYKEITEEDYVYGEY